MIPTKHDRVMVKYIWKNCGEDRFKCLRHVHKMYIETSNYASYKPTEEEWDYLRRMRAYFAIRRTK